MEYKFINMDYLDSVSGGDPEIIEEIVKLFREQAVEIYNEMKGLYAAKDYDLLGLLAHKAKSSVAIMGMNDLAVMLKTFELEAKESKNQENYESYIERFGSDTSAAVIELDDIISTRLRNN